MTNNLLTVHEYTKQYLQVLTKEFSHVSFSMVDERTIEARFKDNLGRLSVDNAYIAYQSDPDSLQQIMASYITSLRSAFSQADTASAGNIIPVIKPHSYLNMTTYEGGPKVNPGVYEIYNNELIILYAMDLPNNVRGLSESDLTDLGITRESLHVTGINNLVNMLTEIQVKGGNGLFMVMAGGTYESSLILHLDLIHKDNFKVHGDIIIAIPNRDVLLITGSNDTQNVAKVATIANQMYSENNYPISPFLFKLIDNKWQKWVQ
jgi:uncharacterized protein YtpQ (UPF0354 family)